MTITSKVLNWALSICLPVVAQSSQQPKVGSIFLAGWIPESTVNGELGQPWMALEQNKQGYQLRELKSIQLLVRSGYQCRFEFPGWKNVRYLFQGVDALKSRRVIITASNPTMTWGSRIPSDTPNFTAKFQGSQCTISQTRRKNNSYDTYTFYFSFNGATHSIYSGTADWGFNEWSVRFIGDLDGDTRPDILLSMSGPKDGELTLLFLSSLAKPGELLGLAANYYLSD